MDANIRTLRIENENKSIPYPIIDLHSSEQVSLSFDDLNPSFRSFSYKITHCNSDWTASDATENEYLNGFSTGYIHQSSSSINTYIPYTHHSISFPNDDVKFNISGNYAISIFTDNNEYDAVLTARFSISDNSIGIAATVSAITDIDYKKEHQQLSIDLLLGNLSVQNPYRDLHVVVQQNQRYDNLVTGLTPSAMLGDKITYANDKKLIFEAGNEFRNFDMSSIRIFSERIEHIRYQISNYHVQMYPDEIRNKAWYTQNYDINGKMIVNLQLSEEDDVEADYFFVHFALPSPLLPDDVYLLGQYNHYHLDKNALLNYNAVNMQYEKTLLLKQGGYDYAYVTVPRNGQKASMKTIEGNYWETENEYAIYVYYKGFTDRYDRLIGTSIILTNK